MDQTTLIINRVVPIILLIALGYWIRRSRFLAENTVDDLRKIVVNLALPAVLFISFLNLELKTEYIAIFVTIFGVCVAMLVLGWGLKRRLSVQREYFPFLMTGFEYGMLGVSLFGSAYGLENIGYIALMDLGHELFIWFVFLGLLLMKRDSLTHPRQILSAFITSPVIIGILAGIGLNLLGARDFLYDSAGTGGIMATLEFLSNMTIPLILIIVGYGIRFDRHGMREAALVTGIRLAIVIPLALLLNAVLIRGLLGLGKPFEAGLFTLLILPPPFIIPLYMRPGPSEERRYVNNTLTFHTVVSIVIYAVYFILNPELF
ncbi:MAG: hypothetical protein GXY36_13715 [Chloroflexi bacterium]|nr:hypothetical protein [Chloroflexota bacterium]